ncbi:MAG: hypothetical protein WD851_09325 [Pirellulales bacterium]
MVSRIDPRRQRPPRPAPNQPGTLRQQFDCIDLFLSLPEYFRCGDIEGAKHVARWHALPHYRGHAA